MANERLNLTGQSEDASSRIITEEEKAQLLGDFKEAQSVEMEKSSEQATQDLRRQKPVTVTREQAFEEAREKGEPLPRFRPSTKASDRLALPTTLPDHGLPELYTPAERILEKASKITGLAPESPHTQMIAQRMAKGDPFSSQALEDAKFETMKLVRAGVIPNPNYKGWTGKINMAYDYAAPVIVEIGLPITTAIVASPMLGAPAPGTRVGYFALLGGASSGGNAVAQNMRIASGLQRSWSWQENLAAGAWGTVPGIGNARNMGTASTVALRAAQGSVMAGGENSTKQGLEILSGDRQEFNFKETGFATGMGLVIGGSLGRLEKALIKYEPRAQAAPLLRKALRDELAEAKRQVKAAERQGGVLTEARKRIEKIEKQLEELAPAEDKALQKAIDELDQVEKKQVEAFELYAKEFSESKAQQVLKQSDQGGVPTASKAAEVDDAPTPPKTPEPDAPTSSTKDKARQILEDFKEGKGTRDAGADVDDPIKARLLTDDPEKQRLINAMQDAIREDLENIKGGRIGKQQYMARVQAEISRRLGAEAGAEFGLVISRSQMSDNVKVADALDELSIHMSANGLVMVKQMDDVLVKLDDVDVNNLDSVNDGVVELMRVIPALMGWKKTGSAAGRLLQSRKIVKDQFDMKLEKIEKALEKNLVKDLKLARNLTPEQRDAQLKTFGELEVVKRLLTVAKEANDIKELRDILVKQQQAFQNRSTVKQFMDGTTATVYTKVRDVAIDVGYSGMLSAPTTWMKVAIGNTLMKAYNAGSGYVGAKYMAMAPWARKGMSKAEFEEAAQFWKTVGTSFFEFSEIANIEARRAFRTGDSDVRSHFERVGQSAMSMERTGLNGVFGQTVENVGQFVDVPGKIISATDAASRIRLAHAMTRAKAENDWNLARQRGEDVPEVFEEYYQGFLRKVFSEDKSRLMTEDAVRKQAIITAEKEGVKAEDVPKYVDFYVKNNWDKDTSAFVNYVDRNTKEVTFTEEIGEFAAGNWLERVPVKGVESLIKKSPIANILLNPFMRTGRNIIREGLGTSSVLADIPGLRRYTNSIWTKTAQDLNSKDPVIVARAKGKQIVAAGILLSFWGLANSEGEIRYVGKQDQNWKKNKNIEIGTGLGEYELRIPDGRGGTMGVDISAAEPIATVANLVADCVTLSKGNPAQQEAAYDAMTILALTVANNIGNKSYYKQFGRFMDIMTVTDETSETFQDKLFRFTKGTAGNVIPFSSASNTLATASDEYKRRGDTVFQVLGKRIGGMVKTVPPQRDVFGDPVPQHSSKGTQATRPINPFPISWQVMKPDEYVKTDKDGFRRINITTSQKSPRIKADGAKYVNIKNETEVRNAAHAVILELNAEFNFNGGTAVKDGIDLREVVHEETRRDAFDRWQEIYSLQKIEGKTVKQAVVLAMSGAASRISNVAGDQGEGVTIDDPRLALVQTILTAYRNASYAKLEKEYPILVSVKKDNLLRNKKFFQGKPSEAFDANATPLEEYKANQPNTRLEQLMIPFAD